MKKNYYSERTGQYMPDDVIAFDVLKRQFLIFFKKLNSEGYFQEYFGISCFGGFKQGKLGHDIQDIFFIELKKENLYPILKNLSDYKEDDLFDVIEFLYEHTSKGIKSTYNGFFSGTEYTTFNESEGKSYFRGQINPILSGYNSGFELSEDGQILTKTDESFSDLIDNELETDDTENITLKVKSSVLKYKSYKSNLHDKKGAIRELADVLEFLRPIIKDHMEKKDENDLFNIANNFAIRHHNQNQKVDYDKPIWYDWMFYYYLATINTLIKLK